MFVQRVLKFLLELPSVLPYLTWAFFELSVMGEGDDVPHHKFVVIAPMIMKFGRAIKLDIFYTLVSRKFVMSPL